MKFAFVFPGQGSQAVGMLNAWGDNAEVKRTLDEASEALGEDVAKLIAEGPAEALSLTTNTQPVKQNLTNNTFHRTKTSKTNRITHILSQTKQTNINHPLPIIRKICGSSRHLCRNIPPTFRTFTL